jgi:hydrogenase maturation protease
MHQTDLVDTLIFCRLAGNCPEAVVIGMEPDDMETMSIHLSPTSTANMPLMAERVLEEVRRLGGTYGPQLFDAPQGGSVCVSQFQHR